MEKFDNLRNKLRACYMKMHYDEFWRLPEDEQLSICQKERQELRNYINSDAISHASLLKNQLAKLEGTGNE
jgi:hypothetical protein